MPVLGVLISLSLNTSGILVANILPDPDKALFWITEIETLSQSRLNPTRLEKLIGRLCFAVYAAWGPQARAYLTPLYTFFHHSQHQPSNAIAHCLAWWRSRLTGTTSRLICFEAFHLPPFIAYSDAEGSGGLGWFLTDSSCTQSAIWAGGSVPPHFLPLLAPRKTQIHALEMSALISLLQSQGSRLRGRRLIAFVDNQSALGILRKGSCNKASDLSSLAAYAHDLCRGLHIELFLYWVPSALNIADGPSRGQPCPLGSPCRLLLHVHQLQTFLTDPALAFKR